MISNKGNMDAMWELIYSIQTKLKKIDKKKLLVWRKAWA